MNTARTLRTPVLGLRPYVLVQLNGDASADVEVGGLDVTDRAAIRDLARTMRRAARGVRREARKVRKATEKMNAK